MWRANFLVGAKCLFFFAIFFFSIFLTMWWQWTWQHATAAALSTVVKFHIGGVYIKHKYQNKTFKNLLRVKELCSDWKKRSVWGSFSYEGVEKKDRIRQNLNLCFLIFDNPPLNHCVCFCLLEAAAVQNFCPEHWRAPVMYTWHSFTASEAQF